LRGAALLLVWELLGRLQIIGSGALPPPSLILQQLWADRALYPPHVLATAIPAAEGFLFGNLLAIIAALSFQSWPLTERLLVGCSVTLFAIPAIALAPVLVVTLSGTGPQIALGGLGVLPHHVGDAARTARGGAAAA